MHLKKTPAQTRPLARYGIALSIAMSFATLGSPGAQASDRYHSVTVAPPHSSRMDATAVRTSVSTEDARRGSADTAQIIQREADVRIRRSGGLNGPAYISIRGSEPEGVRYSLEGIPLHGAGTTVFNVNTLLPELISRVDIYRTTVPIQFGNVSTGGVVDFRLRDSRRSELWAAAGYGSFGSWKASIAGSQPLDDGHLRVSASFRRSQGNFRFYNTNGTDFNRTDDIPNDRRINNDATQGGLMLVRDQQLDAWKVRVISLTDTWEGGVAGMDVAQSQHARGQRIYQNLIFHAQRPLGLEDRTHFGMTSSIQIRRSDFQDKRGEVGLGTQDRTDRQLLAFIAATTTTELSDHWQLSSVFDLQMENDQPVDKISPHYVQNSGRIFPSGGLELRWTPMKDLFSMAVGFRASLYHQRVRSLDVPIAPPPVTNDYSLTPQAGLIFQPIHTDDQRLQLATYFSRSHRQPGFEELFGDSGGTIGNADLTPEKQNALELVAGWTIRSGGWQLDIRAQSWFHWRENAIEYFVLPTGARKPFNIRGARVRGQELSLVAHHDLLTLTLQGGHLHSENLSEDPQIRGSKLPWRSPWSASIDARLRPFHLLSAHYLELIATVRYDAAFYADQRNQRVYPSRFETDIGLEYRSPWPNVPSIRLESYNIFNRRMTTVPGRNGGRDVELVRPISDFNGQPRSGRGFYATLMWQLAH